MKQGDYFVAEPGGVFGDKEGEVAAGDFDVVYTGFLKLIS